MKDENIEVKYGDEMTVEVFPLGDGRNKPSYWISIYPKVGGGVVLVELTNKGRKALRKALKRAR